MECIWTKGNVECPARRAGKYLDMIVCTQCGKEIAEQSTSCPSCGTPLAATDAMTWPIALVEKSAQGLPFDSLYEEYIPRPAPIYERNYAAQSAHPLGTTSPEAPGGEQEKAPGATPVEHASVVPALPTFSERFFPVNTKRALFVEVLLSLFTGLFGTGWLLIGKKRTGTVLLVTSLLFYAPLLIISYALAYISSGISFLFTEPFIAGAVALNAFMLYKAMRGITASTVE